MDPNLCPNCQERFPTTDVVVDEVIGTYSASGYGRFVRRTYRGRSKYGHLLLCPQCAAAYNRLDRLRPIGRRTSNYAFVGLFAGAGIYALGAAVAPALAAGPGALLLVLPFALALLALITGLSLVVYCRVLARSALRFLDRPGLVLSGGTLAPRPAAPAIAAGADGPVLALAVGPDGKPLTPEQRRAARRRRRTRRRLFWGAAIVGWLAVIALIVGGLGFAVAHLQQQTAGQYSYQDPLTGGASGWSQRDGCFSANGAYHISPLGDKYALSCFAPTTNGFTDLDLRVTAQLVSGPDDASYGLIFRSVDPGDSYIFEVFADGHARLDTASTGTVSPLSTTWDVPGMRTGTGQSNDLRVVARGSLITCYVNGSQVGQLSDTRYAGGQVGLYAGMPGMDVAYTNFSVQRP